MVALFSGCILRKEFQLLSLGKGEEEADLPHFPINLCNLRLNLKIASNSFSSLAERAQTSNHTLPAKPSQ